MRKVFYFYLLALTSMVFGLSSCGDKDVNLKNFTMEVDVPENFDGLAYYKVTAGDENKYFYCNYDTKKNFFRHGAAYYAKRFEGEDVGKYPNGLAKGNDDYFMSWVAGTDFVVFAFYVNNFYELDGQVEYMTVHMPEPPDAGEKNFNVTDGELIMEDDYNKLSGSSTNKESVNIYFYPERTEGHFASSDLYVDFYDHHCVSELDHSTYLYQADFTGKKDENGDYLYQGWVKGEDGIKYFFKFAVPANHIVDYRHND